MGPAALRTSLIWHDEVMADLVHERPTPITIGASSAATLLTPDLRLPALFAIVRPGHRGYLLTLGDRMRGTISVGGVEHDVATFVRLADEPSEFRATPIGGSDWGVIELDESGDCKLFFQFVPVDEPTWKLTGPMLDGESRASLAFSVVLHLALLFVTFRLADSSEPFVWPGPRALTGSYIVTRLDAEPPPEPTVTQPESARPGAMAPTVTDGPAPIAKEFPRRRGAFQRPDKAARKDADTEDDAATRPAAGAGVMQFEDVLRGVRDRELASAIKKLKKLENGKRGGPSAGDGLGVGPAGGPRDGGNDRKDGPLGDQKRGGELETGVLRDAVCMGSECGGAGGSPITITLPPEPPTEDPPLRKEDIDRVMKRNKGLFGQCYQRALDRSGATSGTLTVRFVINGEGRVTSSRSSGGNLSGTEVSSCITSKITLLRFPARGGAIVNYPFVFSSGG
jgi:hypothetical protein